MAKATSVYSYSDIAQYLIDGYYRWTLDQSSAPDESPHKFPVSIITYNIDELSPEQQTYALAAMRAWEDVANIHFVTGDQDA